MHVAWSLRTEAKVTTVNLVIPDAVVEAAHLSEPELRLEFALFMYQQDRLTLGQASAFAGISQEEFQQVLGSRKIPVHYGLDDLAQDLETVNERCSR